MSAMEAVRFAVVGTNFISDWFLEAVKQTEEATVLAVCSRSAEQGTSFAARHGIPRVYTTLADCLADSQLDAVYLATPNYLHAPMARECLLMGKHVLCEKPITQSAQDLLALSTLAEERSLVLLEAMRPAFDPAYDALREALARIGRLRRVSLTFCQYSSRYDAFRAGEVRRAFDPAIGNCALADIGIYPLYIAAMLFGEPKGITGCSVRLPNGFEGAGELLLDYTEAGFTATVAYSKIADSRAPSVLEGEDGFLHIDRLTEPTEILLSHRGGGEERIYTATHSGNMRFEVEAFCAMVRGERTAAPHLSTSLATMRLYDAVCRQNGIAMPRGITE